MEKETKRNLIFGCSIFAILLIIRVIRTNLNTSEKEKETGAKGDVIKRLVQEVEEWEQKVRTAYADARSIFPEYKECDLLIETFYHQFTSARSINKPTD